jgi:hypothetical protein
MNACRWSAPHGALCGHLPAQLAPIRADSEGVDAPRLCYTAALAFCLHSFLPHRKYRVSDCTIYHNPRCSKSRITAMPGHPPEKVLELIG